MPSLFGIEDIKSKQKRVNRSNSGSWIDESIILPDVDDEHTILFSKTEGFLDSVFSEKRLTLLLFLSFIFLIILFLRSFQLQILNGAKYVALAEGNRLRTEYIRSDRGLVYDRYQVPLVRNVPNYTLSLVPQYLPETEEKRMTFLTELYRAYLVNYRQDSLTDFINTIEGYYNNPKQKDKPQVVAKLLKQDDAILLQIRSSTEKSVVIDKLYRRDYLNEGPPIEKEDDVTVYNPVKSISHLLGYTTNLREGEYDELKDKGYLFNDVVGRTGIEASYEELLRGEFGKKDIEVDAQGNTKQILAQQNPIDGLNLVTSLDLEFQRNIETIVQDYLDQTQKGRASVIVSNPQNGEILALVSLPSFDNNVFSIGISSADYQELLNDPNHPLFNRSISGEYPSGSTFKPIIAAAALQEGIVTARTSFSSSGGLRINKWFFPDWRAGGHGTTNVYKALSDSVNTYFYVVGGGYDDFEGLGVERITSYAEKFGLSNKLGIDLPGEKSGFLPSKVWKQEFKNERWYIGDTYHLAIGQGDILVTPLQVNMYTAAFANGGTLYEPHLAKSLLNNNAEVVQSFESIILNEDMIDPQYIKIVRDGLRQVVTQGSGKYLADLPFTTSGKTGTAQWHPSKPPHAWFTGYAPSESPQIAFTVLVEEGEEGSGTPVRITKDLLNWWYTNRFSTGNLD